ncbi:hypothetical protein [Bartonella sp. CL434QHHD]|uniref:phage major tropism determinant n=1 Tax=Bartonella sp. CL434QHHD TaxID=3243529 RepID=UPI0035CF501E
MVVRIGGRFLFYHVPGRGRLSFIEDPEAGKDYYIYLILKDQTNEISFEISQNPTAPNGYTEEHSEKIGGFHTLCADVGEIEGHLLSVIQDIILKNTIKSIGCVKLFYMNPLKNPSFYA